MIPIHEMSAEITRPLVNALRDKVRIDSTTFDGEPGKLVQYFSPNTGRGG